MAVTNKKIVIWCGDAPNQRALAAKLARQFNVAGIVIDEHKTTKTSRNFLSLVRAVADRLQFHRIYTVWKDMMAHYRQQFPDWPEVPRLRVAGINDPQTAEFTNNLSPDLVIVSGTGLVKKPLVELPVTTGIINLHTGLSPFVKGGPNCTNWCIANNEWHYTGNTIMWLNAGIDSGNIITTERVDIRGAKDLLSAHLTVMEHAHDLYLRAVNYLLTAGAPYQSVPQQTIDKGKLYLTKMWTGTQKRALLRNWKKRNEQTPLPEVRTVPLPH